MSCDSYLACPAPAYLADWCAIDISTRTCLMFSAHCITASFAGRRMSAQKLSQTAALQQAEAPPAEPTLFQRLGGQPAVRAAVVRSFRLFGIVPLGLAAACLSADHHMHQAGSGLTLKTLHIITYRSDQCSQDGSAPKPSNLAGWHCPVVSALTCGPLLFASSLLPS